MSQPNDNNEPHIDDPFFDGPREVVTTTAGDVALPIHYFDGFCVTALFAIEVDRAAALLADTPLQPVVHNERATAAVTFYDYRHTSIGSYQEVALALLAAPAEASQEIGNYIVDLPVTTPLAEVAGRELWGYPKFVANIGIEQLRPNNSFSGQLTDEQNKTIFTLSGQPGSLIKENTPARDIVTYSRLTSQESVIRTTIPTSSHWNSYEPGTLTLEVGDSQHAMTDRLRQLGLGQPAGKSGATPLRWQTTDNFRSRLPQGEVVTSQR